MEKNLYAEMAVLEETHWWFVGRRKIFLDILLRFRPDKSGKLLDIGLGTGRNAKLFQDMGFEVTGIETSPEAVSFARQKAPGVSIIESTFPSEHVPGGAFSVVSMLDSLEHFEDDQSALRAAYDALRPNGLLLVTVPAFHFLWSPHDEAAHHFRRYIKRELVERLRGAGFEVLFGSYYNFFLFPAILLVRTFGRIFSIGGGSDFSRTPAFLNKLLALIFGCERFLLKFLPLPFGVSLIAVAQKK